MPRAPLTLMVLALLAAYGAGGPVELAVVEGLRTLAPLARVLDWPGDGTPWVIGGAYAVLWGVATKRPHWVGGALFTVAAVLLSGLMARIFKPLFARPRPGTVQGGAAPDFHQYDAAFSSAFGSFPSAHATTAFAGATALWLLAGRRHGRVLFGIAALAAAARVALGRHYPTDVLAGAALGAGITLLLWRYAASASPRAARSTSAMAFARP